MEHGPVGHRSLRSANVRPHVDTLGRANRRGAEAAELRLSVVLDGRLQRDRALELVHLVHLVGLHGIWWRQPPHLGQSAKDLPALLEDIGAAAGQLAVGVMAEVGVAGSDELHALAQHDRHQVAPLARVGGQQGPFVPVSGVVEGAVLLPAWPGRQLAREMASGGLRGPVIVETCVSIGRTTAEAAARADGEELFALLGHPIEQGLFGSLEECQRAAGGLMRYGVAELACNLPLSGDTADVLAQLRAVSVVSPELLSPGQRPSVAPRPPQGWGGRPRPKTANS
jgi:hypothetical protein